MFSSISGRRWLATLLILVMFLCLGPSPVPARADEGQWRSLKTTAARTDNPLKGFMPFGDDFNPSRTTFPYTMEWFYFPLNQVVKGPDKYDWTQFEKTLATSARKGKQVALRFYVDYPGKESGLPAYILDGGEVPLRSYSLYGNNWKSVSPDYNHPKMQALLKNFIKAFGAKYDGDPRIGFITTGLIGFWGEQHTWPMNGANDSGMNPWKEQWMPSRTVELQYYQAWDEAFNTTAILNRFPYSGLKGLNVGFHDDSFAVDTSAGRSGSFMDHMIKSGESKRWQKSPIGGEVPPGI